MAFDVWEIPARLTKVAVRGMSSGQIEEIRARLSRRGPDADFNAVEAAIYLGRSERTLKRAIDAGVGPAREKNPDVTGKGAVNRHIHYPKHELDRWRASLQGFADWSSIFGSFQSLTEDQPWVVAHGKVFCHLLDAGGVEEVMDLLAAEHIQFYRLEEALIERWATLDLRSIYQDQFRSLVERTLDEVRAAADKDALLVETADVARPSVRHPL